ncbi:GMC family oxidoreductase [Balneatrix alpica]|uniref:GMC family oxidoreductase n=1 Tax=Balneatrix alpica TaxID=75684 RepID=A0ABV5ZHF3_9GAMM|nr:GMC family oxidoreductase [Balneatrix alpica]
MSKVSLKDALSREYDVVIVGGGIAGALVAKRLSKAGQRCLILEAGLGQGDSYQGYLDFVQTYYQATVKIPNAPYPVNPNAPEPLVTDTARIKPGHPDEKGYFVQFGPLPFSSSYTRYLGGTTLHWLGTCLRMLPDDFQLYSRYGVGRDWPFGYEQLEPWYRRAEYELGVSAEVSEQAYLGVHFSQDYVYPMHGLPASWSDNQLAAAVNGMAIVEGEESFQLYVRGTPAARNGIPNPAYDQGRGYRPVGAVGNPGVGQRCMGNTACVPICPIQAKYSALKTLAQADADYLDILPQAVATRLQIDPHTQQISAIHFQHYPSPERPHYSEHQVQAKRYVLAAHAVANAVLLLASGACKGNEMVGANLMDHPELLAWGLAPQPLWPLRGPLATSGIEDMRTGAFRQRRAPFRMEMGNDGWLWPTNAPQSDVEQLLGEGHIGTDLRQRLRDQVSRQFRFGILVEQLPELSNRVSIDERYKDALGNYRPVIHYDLSPYTRAGFVQASRTAQQIFKQAGIEDRSQYTPNQAGYFEYEGQALSFFGAGHFAGTHCMGDDPATSVVNPQQRCWQHPNLYLVGCGNMPTLGTSNPTLTMTALTLWAADNLLQDLQGQGHA